MQKLAELYGLSDRGLSKTCERHLVPVPGRGYWAKIEAGQQVKKTPLRAVGNPALLTVHIGSAPSARSLYAAEVVEAALREIRNEDDYLRNGLRIPDGPEPVLTKEKPQTVAKPPPRTVRASTLHPAVRPVLEELRKAHPNRHGFVEYKYISTHPDEIDRIGLFLSTLLQLLEPHGFQFDHSQHAIGMTQDGSRVHIDISTPRKRVTRKGRFGDIQEYEHVGRMAVRIGGRADGTRKDWADTENRRVEDAIDDIVESIRLSMFLRKEADEVERQQQERRAHLAKRRDLAARRAKREESRLEFLNWIADTRREVDELRATIAAVPQSGALPAEYLRMMEWAKIRLANLEAKTSIERIQKGLIENELYTEPDPLFDPEGDPPPKKNSWDD
jgi:hypothetical protein